MILLQIEERVLLEAQAELNNMVLRIFRWRHQPQAEAGGDIITNICEVYACRVIDACFSCDQTMDPTLH